MAQCGLVRIPDTLGQLKGLQILDLHSNKLTDIPDGISTITFTTCLALTCKSH